MRRTHLFVAGVALLALILPAAAGELKGKVTAAGMRNNADAVVYIEAVPGKAFPAPSEHALVDQKGMLFVPHVLAVLAGTTVDFKNSDAVLHNVFTPDKCADKFNLGSWPTGQIRSYTFKQPCAATLLCNVHPEMEGFVVAVPTPYFAVTDKAGAYIVKDLPDGTYAVKVWHPRLKEATQQVTVTGSTMKDFEVKK